MLIQTSRGGSCRRGGHENVPGARRTLGAAPGSGAPAWPRRCHSAQPPGAAGKSRSAGGARECGIALCRWNWRRPGTERRRWERSRRCGGQARGVTAVIDAAPFGTVAAHRHPGAANRPKANDDGGTGEGDHQDADTDLGRGTTLGPDPTLLHRAAGTASARGPDPGAGRGARAGVARPPARGPGEDRAGVGTWLDFYNHRRVNQALEYRTPFEVYAAFRAEAVATVG